jgi:hypothetical protein
VPPAGLVICSHVTLRASDHEAVEMLGLRVNAVVAGPPAAVAVVEDGVRVKVTWELGLIVSDAGTLYNWPLIVKLTVPE